MLPHEHDTRIMPRDPAAPPGPHFDRIAATLAALAVVGLVGYLLIRNEPVADSRLFLALRILLSLSAATLGATIPGFLDIRWSGRGLAIRAGGALALFVLTYVYTPDVLKEDGGKGRTEITAPHGVAAQQITNSTVTVTNTDPDTTAELHELRGMVQALLARSTAPAPPGTERRVGEALTDIARGAEQGDRRLQQALDLLHAGRITDAAKLLRAVAEDKAAGFRQDSQDAALLRQEAEAKTARSRQEGKDAATAYRNLGAIAGLADPKQALDAYTKAIALDPDDTESLVQAAWIEGDRGQLDDAERHYNRVLALTRDDERAWTHYWATLGLGDVRQDRGDLPAALRCYRDARAMIDLLAKSDPGNARWQRDLSVSFEKVGDVLVAQGNLPDALTSYRDGLAIRDRLAKSDPGNAGWQRDLSVSFNKVGDVKVARATCRTR